MDCLDGVVVLMQAESCTAHFGTIELNIGGEEILTPLVSSVALDLCDASPLPQHLVSGSLNGYGDGALEVWACLHNGEPVLFRIAKGSTVDGIEKLLVPESDMTSHMSFLPGPEDITGCDDPVLLTRQFDSKAYYEWAPCSGGTISAPLHVGLAGVKGASLKQVGPGPSFFPPDPGFFVSPLDDTGLNSTEVGIVPLSIYLGRDVGQVNSAGVLEQVDSIPSATLESVLNGAGATQWQQIGFDTGTVGLAPSEGLTDIDICHRRAGSGAKAALDATIMKDSSENSVGVNVLDVATDLTADSHDFFLQSSEGVIQCLESDTQGHPHAIGYMTADQTTKLTGTDAYVVAIDGVLVRDDTAAAARFPFLFPGDVDYDAAAKWGLRCGHYRFWNGAQMNTRPTSSGNPTLDVLITTFVTMASTPASIANSPAGLYWETANAMAVFKNNDAGPHIFKSGGHPKCRPIENPNFPN